MSETFDFLPVCLDGGAIADDDGVCVEHASAACVGPLPVKRLMAGSDIPVPVGGGWEYAHVMTVAPVDMHTDPRPPLPPGACFTTTLREANGDSRIERSTDATSAAAVHNRLTQELRQRGGDGHERTTDND